MTLDAGKVARARSRACACSTSQSGVLGPIAAQLLRDMSAGVITVEPPEGDLTRLTGARRSEKVGALFLANNRDKRSVTRLGWAERAALSSSRARP